MHMCACIYESSVTNFTSSKGKRETDSKKKDS